MTVFPGGASSPLLCPTLVGREFELDALRQGLAQSRIEGQQTFLLYGDAGVGKSRLAKAFADEAASAGFRVVSGFASAQEQSLPYGPFIDALRRALRAPETLESEAVRASLAGIAPELGAFLPELAPFLLPSRPPDNSLPAVERRRLFDGVMTFLSALASPGGLVLLLEDLHWADESSLDLLLYLVRIASEQAMSGGGFCFVLTYRDQPAAEAPLLQRFLDQVTVKRMARELPLEPLPPAAYGEMLEATLGHRLPAGTAEALRQRTEGNPFFTEELLGALAASGRLRQESGFWAPAPDAEFHLPMSVRATVRERLEGLSPAAAEALSYAAVIGREFDFDLLRELTGYSEGLLTDVLRQIVGRQLLVEVSSDTGEDRYRFRHALTRETIESDLLARERRLRHQAVAQALERRAANLPSRSALIDPLAYHYRLGGVPEKAREYALDAALRAQQALAFAEARRYLEAALATYASGDRERVGVVEQLGVLSLVLLDLPAGVTWLEEAVSLHQEQGQARRAAAVLCDLCDLYWYFNVARLREVCEFLPRAALAVQSDADLAGPEDADAVKIYSTVAAIHVVFDQFTEAIAWAENALAVAERLANHGTSVPRSSALYARGLARVSRATSEQVHAGLADLHEALALALQEGQAKVVTLIFNTVPYPLFLLGEDAEAQAIFDAGVEHERRTGAVTMASPAMNVIAGRWNTSLADVEQAVAFSRQFGAPTVTAVYQIGLGHLLADLGRFEEALTNLEEARPIAEPLGQFATPVGPCWWGLARTYAALGQFERADGYYQRCRQLWKQTENRALASWILLEGSLFYSSNRRLAEAFAWTEDLTRLAGATQNAIAMAAAAHAEGMYLLRASKESEWGRAERLLETAAENWHVLGRPLFHARALGRLAEARLQRAGPDRRLRSEAQELLERAIQIAGELGAVGTSARLEDVIRRARLSSPALRRRSARGAQDLEALTVREREVLALLALGRKNREIAEALFIAESTAELHVSRILGKLGLSSRAQAAAWAVANQIGPTTDHLPP